MRTGVYSNITKIKTSFLKHNWKVFDLHHKMDLCLNVTAGGAVVSARLRTWPWKAAPWTWQSLLFLQQPEFSAISQIFPSLLLLSVRNKRKVTYKLLQKEKVKYVTDSLCLWIPTSSSLSETITKQKDLSCFLRVHCSLILLGGGCKSISAFKISSMYLVHSLALGFFLDSLCVSFYYSSI